MKNKIWYVCKNEGDYFYTSDDGYKNNSKYIVMQNQSELIVYSTKGDTKRKVFIEDLKNNKITNGTNNELDKVLLDIINLK